MPVTHLNVDFVMAGTTKAHEVGVHMLPAPTDRHNVMHLVNRDMPPFLQAHFAQRMGRYISFPYASPRLSVFFIYIRRPFVLVVLPALLYPVLLTVLSVRKIRAAGNTAGMLRLFRHIAFLSWQ